jgi:hypothetical protein
MRTTVDLDEDTAKAVDKLRNQGFGMSEAVNELIRRGLLPRSERPPFVQPTAALGVIVDVSNVADALDILEGPEAR